MQKKKLYSSPRLTRLGSISQLTQATLMGGNVDGSFMGKGMTS